MSLIDRLEKVNNRKKALFAYEVRVRRMFFVPKLRDRILKRIGIRWQALSQEQGHIMDMVRADSALFEQWRACQGRVASSALPEMAATVVSHLASERKAKTQYQDGVWYHKGGEWKAHGISEEAVIGLVKTFKEELDAASERRIDRQLQFERSLAGRGGAREQLIARERLLLAARNQHLADQQNEAEPSRLELWHLEQTGHALMTRVPERDQLPPERRHRRARGR